MSRFEKLPLRFAEQLCVTEHTGWDNRRDECIHTVVAVSQNGVISDPLRALNCEILEIPSSTRLEISNIKELRVITAKVKESAESEGKDMADEKKEFDPSQEKKDTTEKKDAKPPKFDDKGNSKDDGVEFESEEKDEPEAEVVVEDGGDDEVGGADDVVGHETPSLIGGGGLINILHNLIPLLTEIANKGSKLKPEDTPFDVLGNDDFDSQDPTVQQFKNDGGCKTILRLIKVEAPGNAAQEITAYVRQLQSIRTASRTKLLRQAFSAIKAAQNSVIRGPRQAEAAEKLTVLIKDTFNASERHELKKAYSAVLSSDWDKLDAASFRVRNVFSQYVQKPNTRLAYTNLETQGNESYLMCPKAVHQIGMAVPMETSKCRDHCIDSRTDGKGTVACAYNSWLKVADSHEVAWNSMDRQRHPDNEENLLTLAKGERSKPLKSNEIGYEARMELEKVHTWKEDTKDRSVETLLDSKDAPVGLGHHGDPKDGDRPAEKFAKGQKVNRITPDSDDTMGEQISKDFDEYGDETWEEMLADEHKGLSDDDLDKVVELLLAEDREDKK